MLPHSTLLCVVSTHCDVSCTESCIGAVDSIGCTITAPVGAFAVAKSWPGRQRINQPHWLISSWVCCQRRLTTARELSTKLNWKGNYIQHRLPACGCVRSSLSTGIWLNSIKSSRQCCRQSISQEGFPQLERSGPSCPDRSRSSVAARDQYHPTCRHFG